MTEYRNIDDLPGDPVEMEYGARIMRALHAACPFEDVVWKDGNFLLITAGEVGGEVTPEMLNTMGAQA